MTQVRSRTVEVRPELQVRPLPDLTARDRVGARARGWEPTAPQVVLAAVTVAWIVTFAVLVYKRQSHFWSVDFDMGLHDQSVWLLAHGRGFLTIRGLQVFGHHATFGYYFFVPFYWLGAGAQFLNLAQVVVVALGAVPLFLLARERVRSEWAAAALAAAFLFHPALQFFTSELFHPEVMAITPLLCAYYCSVRRRWGWFALWCIVAVSWKEDVALAVIVLAVIVAVRGDRRVGLITGALALAWFSLWTFALFPAINGGAVESAGLYAGIGGTPSGVVATLVHHPSRIAGRIFDAGSGDFLWHLLAPLGFLPMLSPVLLLGLPQLAVDLLSDVPWTRTITFHYAALPVAALALATVEGAGWLWRVRRSTWVRGIVCGYVLACALLATFAWGPSPVGAAYHSGIWPPTSDRRLSAVRAAVDLVPDGVAVSASYTLVPQLSHRAEIYSFPNPWEARNWGTSNRAPTRDAVRVRWLVVDRTVLGPADRALLDGVLADGSFRVVYRHAGMVVAKRVRS